MPDVNGPITAGRGPTGAWQFVRRRPTLVVAVLLFLGSLALYTSTMAPGLSWENKGGDGGDFLAAAHTWGIPHPTGYPTYIVLLRGFSEAVPAGDEAWRGNLFSALFGALTVPVVFLAVNKLLLRLPMSDTGGRRLPLAVAAVTAAAFATSNLHWSQATITEVYALNAFFVATLIWLSLVARSEIERGRRALPVRVAIALLLGVALGNHVTIAITAAPFAVWVHWPLFARERWRLARDWQPGLMLLVGLGTYAYAPLASAQDPPLNWFFPDSFAGFRAMASASIYQPYAFGVQRSFLDDRVIATFDLWLTQFTAAGAILGLAGASFLWSRLRGFAVASLVALVSLTVYTVAYNSFDSYVFLIPAFMIFALWIAAGLLSLLASLRSLAASGRFKLLTSHRARLVPAVIGVAIIAMPVWSIAFNYSGLDISADREAEEYVEAAMAAAGQGGVIIAEDIPTFSLWYQSLVAEPERDVAVIATFLLGFDWYWDHIRRQFPDRVPEDRPDGWTSRIRAIAAHNIGNTTVLLTHADTGYGDLFELVERGDLWEVTG